MKIGIIQITSTLDYKENLKKIRSFLKDAKDQGVKQIYLAECFYSLSNGVNPSTFLVEDDNEHFKNILSLGKDFGIYIVGGTAATKVGSKIMNRTYNISPEGKFLDYYDKINLFSCEITKKDGTKKIVDEGRIYSTGNELKILDIEGTKIGLGVCFDLRFSEMALKYRQMGAQILTYSSAFTKLTGKAHWEVLLRARAIESQCFVVAAGQWGQNHEHVSTYGHSLIIDPWGNILADAGEGEKLITAEIDLNQILEVRKSVHMDI